MKIGIIGDLHYGAGFNLGRIDPKTQLNTRLLDYVKTFDSIIDTFEKEGVKYVAITGDIFDTRHPTSAQLNAFSKCVRRAIEKGMNMMLLVGNHDQQRTISTTTIDIYNSLGISGITVHSEIENIKLEHNGETANIVFMPYRDRRMVSGHASSNSEAVSIIQKELSSALEGAAGKKIAIGHFMVGKAVTGQSSERFSMSELILPPVMFKDFDAVIMGHVHQHEILRTANPVMMYIGAMEKTSFGEKNHKRVSVVLDTNNLNKPKIINTNVRNLYVMDFDYTSDSKYYKHEITNQIIKDIGKFNKTFDLSEAVVKLIVRVKENDLYHVDQSRIKKFILSKNVNYLVPMQISMVSSRNLRNKNITETADGKNATKSYIKQLQETDQMKEKLIKFASTIIEEVEGK
jgi:exonuclease SbcD